MSRLVIIASTLTAAAAVSCQSLPELHEHAHDEGADRDIGVMVYVGDEVIRNYRPRPALHVETRPVPAARHAAVDVHCHWDLEPDPAAMLAAMDERNVRAAVNLSGGWGETLDRMLERYHRFAPDRLFILCNIDFSRIDEPCSGRRWRTRCAGPGPRARAGSRSSRTSG